jgi:hypothetical protein
VNTDFRGACIAWLLANPVVVTAFGATGTDTKFWSDWVGPNADGSTPGMPYLIFIIPNEHETFESIDQNGNTGSTVAGILTGMIFTGSRAMAVQLATLVGNTLQDAPLVFGTFTAGAGTVAIANGSTEATFSQPQTGIDGLHLAITGDTSNGLYCIAGGSGTIWTLCGPFGGTTVTSAAWQTTDRGLIYLRRTEQQDPVVPLVGPDGSAINAAAYVHMKYIIERTS